jgi:hypothetical protein
MKDFVLAKHKEYAAEILKGLPLEISYKEHSKLCVKYANFLNQPLTLGMFITCDEKGNILQEPIYYKSWVDNKYTNTHTKQMVANCENYQQAKERVLFERVDLDKIENFKRFVKQSQTVEFMIQFNHYTLTSSAIKKLGL